MGSCKRLVELLQVLSLRWKVDKATINIYHKYDKCGIQRQPSVAGESSENRESSYGRDWGVSKPTTSPGSGKY